MPHIGEQIFKNISTPELLEIQHVSKTWKVLVENAIVERWKGKLPSVMETLKSGKAEVVKLLLERSKIEAAELNRHYDGLSIFMWACKNGHIQVVRQLLQRSDIDFNAEDSCESKNTAFIWACQCGHRDVVKLLLENSDSIDYNAVSGEHT